MYTCIKIYCIYLSYIANVHLHVYVYMRVFCIHTLKYISKKSKKQSQKAVIVIFMAFPLKSILCAWHLQKVTCSALKKLSSMVLLNASCLCWSEACTSFPSVFGESSIVLPVSHVIAVFSINWMILKYIKSRLQDSVEFALAEKRGEGEV